MIIRVLIAVVLAVQAYFYTMRYNIHMFQQNGYKNKEHLHWLKKKFRLQWILYFGLALGIVTCVFPYLALEIFEYLVLLVIIVVYRPHGGHPSRRRRSPWWASGNRGWSAPLPSEY